MNALLSTIIYLVCFGLSALLVYLAANMKTNIQSATQNGQSALKRKALLSLAIAIPILLGFIRYGVGTDYENYLKIYQCNADGTGCNGYLESIEPVFKVLAKSSYDLTGTPLLFFGIALAATVIFMYLGVKRILRNASSRTLAKVWLLTLLIMLPLAFNQIRSTLAISIFMFSFPYMLQGRFLKYLLMTGLAMLCHESALFIMLPAYAVARYSLGVKSNSFLRYCRRLLLLGSITAIVVIGLIYILEPILLTTDAHHYVRAVYRMLVSNDSSGLQIGGIISIERNVLILFGLYLVPLLLSKRVDWSTNGTKRLLHTLWCMGIVTAIISLFVTSIGSRISLYFVAFMPCAIGMLQPAKSGVRELFAKIFLPYRTVVAYVMVVVFFLGWNGIVPYNTIFSDIGLSEIRSYGTPVGQLLCDLDIKKDCVVESDKGDNKSLWSPYE